MIPSPLSKILLAAIAILSSSVFVFAVENDTSLRGSDSSAAVATSNGEGGVEENAIISVDELNSPRHHRQLWGSGQKSCQYRYYKHSSRTYHCGQWYEPWKWCTELTLTARDHFWCVERDTAANAAHFPNDIGFLEFWDDDVILLDPYHAPVCNNVGCGQRTDIGSCRYDSSYFGWKVFRC